MVQQSLVTPERNTPAQYGNIFSAKLFQLAGKDLLQTGKGLGNVDLLFFLCLDDMKV